MTAGAQRLYARALAHPLLYVLLLVGLVAAGFATLVAFGASQANAAVSPGTGCGYRWYWDPYYYGGAWRYRYICS